MRINRLYAWYQYGAKELGSSEHEGMPGQEDWCVPALRSGRFLCQTTGCGANLASGLRGSVPVSRFRESLLNGRGWHVHANGLSDLKMELPANVDATEL